MAVIKLHFIMCLNLCTHLVDWVQTGLESNDERLIRIRYSWIRLFTSPLLIVNSLGYI